MGALVLAVMLRLAVSSISIGSNDASTWFSNGESIHSQGLAELYRTAPMFNHPPLMGHLAEAAYLIAGDRVHLFAFIFKLPAIAADLGSIALLWAIWSEQNRGRLAALTLALSPVAILISSYHGNTDSIAAFLSLLAVYLIATRHMALAGGLALAAAGNVKLIPLLLVVPIVLSLDRRTLLRFALGMAVGLTPLIVAAISVGGAFYQNVVTYDSQYDRWGVMLLLAHDGYTDIGRYAVLFGTVVASWYLRRSLYTSAAVTMSLFLILAPGFGVQYLIYPLPLLATVGVAWGAVYSVLGGALLILTYSPGWDGSLPLESIIAALPPLAAVAGLALWAVLIAFVGIRLVLRHARPVGSTLLGPRRAVGPGGPHGERGNGC